MVEWSDWYRREDPEDWVLPRVLRLRAEAHPERDYLRVGDGPWLGYGEVNARANRVANALAERGLRPGEAVSTLLPNCLENVLVWFGIQKAGGGSARSTWPTGGTSSRGSSTCPARGSS